MFLIIVVHLFLGSTMAGVAMVAGLTMGYDTMQPVIYAALIGWLLSIPATWVVAKMIRNL